MNNFCKYFCGSLFLVGLASCASEEPALTEIPRFEGDKAVMNINIFATGESTRADGPSASYGKGSDDENYVRKLNFYFYDKAGEYVTCKEGVAYTASGTGSSHLVEEIGTSRIVLTDLLGQNYPSYVVAVLNYNTGNTGEDNRFKKGLRSIYEELRSSNPWSENQTSGKITDFVMTNATHSGNAEDFYYFATPVSEENFALQPEGATSGDAWDEAALKAKPVDIYVERLAAKIELKFPGYTLSDEGYYEVKLPDSYIVDGKETKLTVRLLGWGVNGLAKEMKYFKGVNDNPNPFKTDDGWDYSGTNRCYWAKTPGYGSAKYSSSFADVDNKSSNPESQDNDDAANEEPLKYISWKKVTDNTFKNGDNIAYVMPHTEHGSQINLTGNQIHHSALTEVLISGRIVDAEGNGMTLFQLGESYYTRDGVLNYILNAAGSHIWKKVTAEGGKPAFRQIEPSDVDVKYGYDGTFSIVITNTAEKWFQDNEGQEAWASAEAVEKEINAYLPSHQSYCYNDGMLYYVIPIRHLRPYTEGEAIKTGMFGVVRNHWYQVSVGQVRNLGHAVYRPHEHIIPPSDATRYMIGSSIKILSWRIVAQTAEL